MAQYLPYLVIGICLVASLGFRLMAGSMDKDRVRQYVEGNGGRLISCTWEPFGPGWFGGKNERIYRIRFTDRQGLEHDAHCKTSMWSGVYLTEDRVIDGAGYLPAGEADLAAENRRLREEVQVLRREQGKF